MHRGALEAALSTHCGTSSSAELWSDPALPHLCSCPGAKWCASASAPPLAPKLIKPWVLIPCSWMLGGRGGGGCYNSDMPSTGHIHRSRGCRVDPVNTVGKTKIWAWDARIYRHTTCAWYATCCHSSSSAPDALHQAPTACTTRKWKTYSHLLLLAESIQPTQPPPAHTTVTLRGGRSSLSSLRAGKIPGRRAFPRV